MLTPASAPQSASRVRPPSGTGARLEEAQALGDSWVWQPSGAANDLIDA